MEEVTVNYHSSIKINNTKIIYIDPYKIKDSVNDADIILITHSHFDHFSEEDILKVKNNSTLIFVTKDLYQKTLDLGFEETNITVVNPNKSYEIDENISFDTIPAYNTNKQFHQKEYEWVGYIININDKIYYIAGDTDITDENKKVKCDIAFIPIGGTYTMNYKEAAELVNIIKPKTVIPVHYNAIVGTKKDEEGFKKLLDNNIVCKILL